MKNFIRVDDVEIPIDLGQSGVSASIENGCNDVTISLSASVIEGHNELHDVVSMDLAFVPTFELDRGWQSLSNQKIERNYEADNDFILPDDPATIYMGWHLRATNNSIQFGDFENGGFRILWTCIGKEIPDDAGTAFTLNSWLPITDVCINFPELFRSVVESTPEDDVEAMEMGFENLKIDAEQSLANF
jgi:hypothetical protein